MSSPGAHRRHQMERERRERLGETDLRQIDIHPNASLGTVVRAMSCKRCSPHPPFARPLGATRRSWEGKDKWRRRREAETCSVCPD
jgi:hypothetical protein